MIRRINYQELSFWEQRYKQNMCQWYEWLCTPNQISAFIQQQMPQKQIKILQIGCGSSNLAEKMLSIGYQDITCIDFSKQIIKSKQKASKQGIVYKCHDCLEKFPYGEEEFDLIIQKNTVDCLFCFDDFPSKVLRCMKQCHRMLKKEGKMISISHAKPKSRKLFYRNRFAPFSLKFTTLSSSQTQFCIFVLVKGEGQSKFHQLQQEEKVDQYEKEGQNEYQINSNNNVDQRPDEDQDNQRHVDEEQADPENNQQMSQSQRNIEQQGQKGDCNQAFDS